MTSAPVAALSASRSCLRRLLVAVLATLLLAPAVLAQPEEPPAEAVYEAGHPGLEPPTRRPESREPVPYPQDAGGEKGRVILRVRVSPGGSVTDVEVVRAPYKGDVLRRAAIDAARGWRYQPARLDGEDVSCWLVESVEFYRIELATPPPAAPAATRRVTPPDDTPASLQKRVLAVEHEFYPAVLAAVERGEVDLDAIAAGEGPANIDGA